MRVLVEYNTHAARYGTTRRSFSHCQTHGSEGYALHRHDHATICTNSNTRVIITEIMSFLPLDVDLLAFPKWPETILAAFFLTTFFVRVLVGAALALAGAADFPLL